MTHDSSSKRPRRHHTATATASDAPRRSVSWIPWAIAAAAAGLAVWFAQARKPATTSDPLAALRVERLTYDAGLTTMPAISRDGRLIAYASDRAGRGDLDIWVQLADGAPLRLTDDPADEEPAVLARRQPDRVSVGTGRRRRLCRPRARRHAAPDRARGPQPAVLTRRFAARLLDRRIPRRRHGGLCDICRAARRGRWRSAPHQFETARDPIWSPDGRAVLVAAMPRRAAGVNEVDWWWTPVNGDAPAKPERRDSRRSKPQLPAPNAPSGPRRASRLPTAAICGRCRSRRMERPASRAVSPLAPRNTPFPR